MYVSGGHYVKFAPLRIDVMMMLLCLSYYDPTVKQSTEARQLCAFSQHPIRRIRSRHRYRRAGSARVLHRPESRPDCCVHDGRPRRIQLKALLLHPVEPCRDHQLSLRHTAGPRKPGAIRHIRSFAQEMRTMRGHLAQANKLHYKYQKERWFLDAADVYCGAVNRLTRDVTLTDLRSRGFLAFREYLTSYTESGDFASLVAETQKLTSDLSGVRYSLHIEGSRIKVGRYDSEPDYGAD